MRIFLKLSIAALCTLAFATASSAQGYGQSASNGIWTGLYLGGHGGGAWGEAEDNLGGTIDVDGGLGGIHGGYNMSFGEWVIGIEGDYSWSGAEGSQTTLVAPGIRSTATVESEYLASIRGRVGYAFNDVLVYGTAGVGFSELDVALAVTAGNATARVSGNDTITGFVGGGGIEWKPMNNISVRAEVLHYSFGDADIPVTSNGQQINLDADLDQTVVRGGVTFHLN